MCSILKIGIHLLSSYSCYFDGDYISKSYNDSRMLYATGNCYVFGSIFYDISFSGSGGAFYIYNIETRIVIEDCTLSNCRTTSGDGGAISFKPNKGGIVLSKVCANNCYTNSGRKGQFCVIEADSLTWNYLSVTKCTIDQNSQSESSYIAKSQVIIESTNYSYNEASNYAVFHFYDPLNISIMYCTFDSNWAESGIILFNRGTNVGAFQASMNFSNFVRNHQISGGSLIAQIYANLSIYECVLVQNNASDSVKVIDRASGVLYLIDCYLQSSIIETNGFVIVNNKGVNDPTLFTYYQTQLCFAENPYTPDPTTLFATPTTLFATPTIDITHEPSQGYTPNKSPDETLERTRSKSFEMTPCRTLDATLNPNDQNANGASLAEIFGYSILGLCVFGSLGFLGYKYYIYKTYDSSDFERETQV